MRLSFSPASAVCLVFCLPCSSCLAHRSAFSFSVGLSLLSCSSLGVLFLCRFVSGSTCLSPCLLFALSLLLLSVSLVLSRARSVSVSLVLAVSCSLGLSRWLSVSLWLVVRLVCRAPSSVWVGAHYLSASSFLCVSLFLTVSPLCSRDLALRPRGGRAAAVLYFARVPWPVGRGADARMKSSVLCVS